MPAPRGPRQQARSAEAQAEVGKEFIGVREVRDCSVVFSSVCRPAAAG